MHELEKTSSGKSTRESRRIRDPLFASHTGIHKNTKLESIIKVKNWHSPVHAAPGSVSSYEL